MNESKPITNLVESALNEFVPNGWHGKHPPFKVLNLLWTYEPVIVEPKHLYDLHTLFNNLMEKTAMCATSCPSKPWDTCRATPESKPLPFKTSGTWLTRSCGPVLIGYEFSGPKTVRLQIPPTRTLTPDELRQIAEFCTELAAQRDNS
jgi:hypothetical protein